MNSSATGSTRSTTTASPRGGASGELIGGRLQEPTCGAADTKAGHPVRRVADQRGQSTVEYALLLLGAAAIAMLVVAWVAKTDMIGRLFEVVLGRILGQA